MAICYIHILMRLSSEGLLIGDPEGWLNAILIAFNDENSIRRSEMRRLEQAWRDCGRDSRKLLSEHPELKEYLYDKSGKPAWWAVLIPQGSGFRVALACHGPQRGMTWEEMVRDEARRMFMQFLMNPLREVILGPCAWKRCEKYFRQKGKKRTEYCSRRCCQLASATRFRVRQLEAERNDKLKRAAAAAQEWITTRTKDDWKTYVCRCESDISPKFLTRAMNTGELTAPIAKSQSK